MTLRTEMKIGPEAVTIYLYLLSHFWMEPEESFCTIDQIYVHSLTQPFKSR